jgi:hypothetical protein
MFLACQRKHPFSDEKYDLGYQTWDVDVINLDEVKKHHASLVILVVQNAKLLQVNINKKQDWSWNQRRA